jgi:hypothetical protein
MSPYVEVVAIEDEEEEGKEKAENGKAAPAPDEALVRCTECEYTAPRSEFVPENYR